MPETSDKKMTLHIFNPEHDLSIACNMRNFTPPYAARQLRDDLGYIPALWASEGDAVLVSDKTRAVTDFTELKHSLGPIMKDAPLLYKGVTFVEENGLAGLCIDKIDVWGWDVSIRERLERIGVDRALLPDDACLDTVRELSHRRNAATLLKHVKSDGMAGDSYECTDYDSVERLLAGYGNIVVKAPWSSCGRGLRLVQKSMTVHQAGWVKNMLKAQGSVIIEPYYNKIMDFGMEFVCRHDGVVDYAGLSLFDTDNWSYTGSLLATEDYKRGVLSEYIRPERLDEVMENIAGSLGRMYAGRYIGPFGVDMMIVAGEDGRGCMLHPCVEINLRRTMGHTAVMMTPMNDMTRGMMRIEFINNKYQLKINSL